jgi:ribosome-associated translation inhibitor RaiA
MLYLLCTLLILPLATPAMPTLLVQGAPVRAYIFTEPTVGGFTDRASERRSETVAHAIERLQKKHKKRIIVVDSAESADVVIEILAVPEAEGTTSNMPNLFMGSTSRKKVEVQVQASLSVGDYSVPITTQDPKLNVAARLVADELDRWVKKNRERLIRRRE